MKTIKLFSIIVICIVSGFILGFCGSNSYAYNSKENTTKENVFYIDSFSKDDGQIELFQYIDQETGVNYFIVGSWNQYHNRYEGISITPRFDNSGNIYIIK